MEPSQSHLFSIRIWTEEGHNMDGTWRGQVEHVLSGERQYFRDWETLVKFLQTLACIVDRFSQANPGEKSGDSQT